MRALVAIGCFGSLVGIGGCGGGSTPGSDAGTDAAIDAAVADTGHASDAGTDAAVSDAGTEGGTDAGAPGVDAAGPDSGVPCDPTTDCGVGYYCHTVDGMCDGGGVCEDIPQDAFCPGVDVVCGCDGNDYVNRCSAARHGAAIDHEGGCDGGTGCTSDLDCPAGPGLHGIRFCEYADGACGGIGVCTSTLAGVLCTLACQPQCGCDGVSYRNACVRQQGATSTMGLGNCPLGPPACEVVSCCTSATDCAIGQMCVPASDPGSTASTCEPIPTPPDCWRDEDCGAGMHCDGVFVCPCGSTCPRPDTTGTCA